jgi:hypothetical protein
VKTVALWSAKKIKIKRTIKGYDSAAKVGLSLGHTLALIRPRAETVCNCERYTLDVYIPLLNSITVIILISYKHNLFIAILISAPYLSALSGIAK